MNSCIHSGSNDYIDRDTVWYDYALASAGTISNKDASDTAGNLNTAIESICPNGWNLPSRKQIDSNRNISSFSPILGGNYGNGALHSKSDGSWWGSEASRSATRYYLIYNISSLYAGSNLRIDGRYIRCVSEEKTVTDLTYMQDMTPQIAPALSLCI